MKTFSCIVLLVASAMSSGDKPQYDIKDAPELFEKFIIDYDRHYENEADRMVHYEAFVKALREINKLNTESNSATFDINQFTDYTPREFKNMRGIPRIPRQLQHFLPGDNYH